MKYLICERCFGYYELQADEFPEDFESCQCGGFLECIEDIDKFMGINDTTLVTKYVCPNIYCNYKKPLNKGKNCPKCGSSVNGSGFKESMHIFKNNSVINQNNSSSDLLKCPNPSCNYESIPDLLNCPVCGMPFKREEESKRPRALGLVSIKGSGELQKGDFFYRMNDED
jgi:endogenous inhibitor of DNA gyrase (YacG/DUF329 family)